MTVAYATSDDLRIYLQQATIDNAKADQAIRVASSSFSQVADTWWAKQTTTYQQAGNGSPRLVLPFRPVVSIQAVRIAGAAITDYTLIRRTLYRTAGSSFGYGFGFGSGWNWPPDLVEVDLTYGYSIVPDDVMGAVIESAASALLRKDTAISLDRAGPFEVRYNEARRLLTDGARELAESYAGTFAA